LIPGVSCQIQRLCKCGVRDADQHRNAPVDLAANAFHKLTPQAITEAGTFAGCAQQKQAAHAASDDVLDQALQSPHVELVSITQRRDHGGNNASQGCFHFFTDLARQL
jgi:hypothetical protein